MSESVFQTALLFPGASSFLRSQATPRNLPWSGGGIPASWSVLDDRFGSPQTGGESLKRDSGQRPSQLVVTHSRIVDLFSCRRFLSYTTMGTVQCHSRVADHSMLPSDSGFGS